MDAWTLPNNTPTQQQARNIALGRAIDIFIKDMKNRAYIKRVVKNVKYTANGGRTIRRNLLKLMRFKTYTGPKSSHGGYLFGFSQNDDRFRVRTLNFSEWAMRMRATGQGGGAKMKGGMNGASTGETKQPAHAMEYELLLWRLFPGDFAGAVWYYEGEDDEKALHSRFLDHKNLTKELFKNLIGPLYSKIDLSRRDVGSAKRIDEYNGIVATIYSQYCYESWIDGQAATRFPLNYQLTLSSLLIECELNPNLIRKREKNLPRLVLSGEGKLGEGKPSITMRKPRAGKVKRRHRRYSRRGDFAQQWLSGLVGGKKKTRKKKRRKRKKTRRRRRKKGKRKTRRKR
jgi:hypothetical protein